MQNKKKTKRTRILRGKKSNRLSKKQEGFVQDYVKTGNATRAALNNYDVKDGKVSKERVAEVIGSQNLSKVIIIEKILVEGQDKINGFIVPENPEACAIVIRNFMAQSIIRASASSTDGGNGGLAAASFQPTKFLEQPGYYPVGYRLLLLGQDFTGNRNVHLLHTGFK